MLLNVIILIELIISEELMAKQNNVCVIGTGRFGTAVIEQLIE